MEHAQSASSPRRFSSLLLTAGLTLAFAARGADAQAVSEDIPVPGGLAALARALDIDAPDAARCIPELVRFLYGESWSERDEAQSPQQRLIAHFAAAPPSATRTMDVVPVPLTADGWSAVLGRGVAPSALFAAILSDRNAALLAHGLAALDDETLRFFAAHPALLRVLHRRHATAFTSFTAHLRVHGGRVVTPGSDRAVPLWESLLGERVTNPVAFVTALYAKDEGRLAYLYDVIAHLDSAHAAFALGLWLPDHVRRVDRFHALARASSSPLDELRLSVAPFARPTADLLTLLHRVQVDPSGAPRFPASQQFWTAATADAGEPISLSDDDPPIDAAWLAAVLLRGDSRQRGERLDQFGFGHRAFATALGVDASDMIVAINRFPQLTSLMLTLERMGMRRPATYAALSRHADQLTQLDMAQERRALAQFQGVIALIARMVRVGRIARAAAEQLLDALAVTPIDLRHGYAGAIAAFLARHVGPAIGAEPGTAFDEALLLALSGPRTKTGAVTVSWEAQTYVFDLAASEARRLRRFLEHRGVATLNQTLAIQRHAVAPPASATEARAVADIVAALPRTLTQLTDETSIVQRLTTPSTRSEERRRSLLEAVDVLTADALLSFSYAIAWNDSTGSAQLDRELPRRHDFGLTTRSKQVRERAPWALPRLVFSTTQSWRIAGAVLGLEMALAPLSLRRIDAARPHGEPRLLSTNRYSFLQSLGLLDVFALNEADVGAIAEAISRGRHRVSALTFAGRDTTAVINDITMDGWRARSLRWNIVHAPDQVTGLFSLTELLHLGGGAALNIHAWGTSALTTLGCLCTVVPSPAARTGFVGRHHLGMLPAMVPDLNLRVAVLLHDLQLPAALARQALESALYDFLADVRPMHPDDWLALVRRAQALSPERLADGLAVASASAGPLSPVPSARRLP